MSTNERGGRHRQQVKILVNEMGGRKLTERSPTPEAELPMSPT